VRAGNHHDKDRRQLEGPARLLCLPRIEDFAGATCDRVSCRGRRAAVIGGGDVSRRPSLPTDQLSTANTVAEDGKRWARSYRHIAAAFTGGYMAVRLALALNIVPA
jgi:hypothetical protein